MRAGVSSGDPDAFAELFERHARTVYNHAFRLTGSWSTAEDVVAITFLEAWRLRRKIDLDGGSLRPWLLGIATNVARNTTRAARRHHAVLARLLVEPATPDFADEVVGRIDDVRSAAEVARRLGCLRPGERDVVALVVWADLGQEAAAEALGISVGTVRSRLSRARSRLRASVTLAQGDAGRVRYPGVSGRARADHPAAARPGQEACDEQ